MAKNDKELRRIQHVVTWEVTWQLVIAMDAFILRIDAELK